MVLLGFDPSPTSVQHESVRARDFPSLLSRRLGRELRQLFAQNRVPSYVPFTLREHRTNLSLIPRTCYTPNMPGRFVASLPIQRSMLVFVLCLLTFLFAIEAKLAWYSPARDIYGQVSAAKALRADAPALVAHGAPAPDQAHNHIAFSALALQIAFSLAAIETLRTRLPFLARPSFIPPYLLSPIDFRPPPAR
jgi:hypothetical protein